VIKPFDFVSQINGAKKNLIVESDDPAQAEKDYVPYLTNRALSYFADAIFQANNMNMYPDLDNRLQFDFLLNSVRRRKRFAKWVKPEPIEDIEVVQQYYQYSTKQARQVMHLFTDEHMSSMKQELQTGGVNG